ncbi:UTRA domain-containing protein [Pseudomonas citronellolis]|uniref:UTRA domain-containing protein n=1 Tax=Pseudomonas citronellolis TaxID=53408 RepID=UPI0023E366AC|nr:UTRA domain-containing protein [Pseudomonas citronellolis]MDF3933180.1 UTRA domain-containing protein [Pseudomonas citronellolis]
MAAERPLHYLRIRDQLARQLADGGLAARLPGERELAERFGCTRVTLREALQQLETEGLLYRENRRGWFVAPPRVLYDPARSVGFMEYVAAQGRRPRTETLARRECAADAQTARRMGLEEGARLFSLERRRWIDERPVLLERILLDAAWCPGLLGENLDTSLTGLLRERFGKRLRRCRLAMHPCALGAAEAELLQLAPGAPGLFLERVSHAEDDRVVELDQEFWRPDALEIVVESRYPD